MIIPSIALGGWGVGGTFSAIGDFVPRPGDAEHQEAGAGNAEISRHYGSIAASRAGAIFNQIIE
jgi:hypothetical protein